MAAGRARSFRKRARSAGAIHGRIIAGKEDFFFVAK
jgi:hypothetical protein